MSRTNAEVAMAELVNGPFDGLMICLMPDSCEWPEFQDLGISSSGDTRRALYRFEPLASGVAQYVFDRRYTRA